MKCIAFFIFFIASLFSFSQKTFAVDDPRSVPNNKFGIHILFPTEIDDAARLVNTSGGDWGYVTIPIQSGDRDRTKWQNFMDEARQLHIIPIVRLATEGDYFNTAVWRKPTYEDVLDFANFLNDLTWPTKNKYVVIFNEVNRDDEWGGDTNPAEYTDILIYAIEAFKTKNQDFFIISAGLDNGAGNGHVSINQYDFMRQMHAYNEEVFTNIDGFASHSYPNPDFSSPPSIKQPTSIWSFRFEQNLIKQLSGLSLPIFITETGWRNDKRDEQTIASFYKQAFDSAWNDEDIVTVTPFLFQAGTEPFNHFSFLKSDGSYTEYYSTYKEMIKPKGAPALSLINTNFEKPKPVHLDLRSFPIDDTIEKNVSLVNASKDAFYWIMKIKE